ncbi:disrupted in schizophrenia 1 protein [Tiliqua scincoides]|uniref:disrupted in schizophrenia 1 protein n=1 Tax=Tiliqua scincoides TaxID=71010 RepID=UPI003463208C
MRVAARGRGRGWGWGWGGPSEAAVAAAAEDVERSGGRQPQRGPPSSGGTEPSPEAQVCSLPTSSFRKKKLAKRPGYMRPKALQQTEFQPSYDCEPFSPKGLEHHGRKQHRDLKNCFLKRPCENDLEIHCDVCVNSTMACSNLATRSALAENSVGYLGNQTDCKVKQSENLILSVCPTAALCKEDVLLSSNRYSGQTSLLDPAKETTCSSGSQEKGRMHSLGQKVNDNWKSDRKEVVCSSLNPPGHFNSSFSFIQHSLNLAFEMSGVGGCSEPKGVLQICEVGKVENVNLHVPGEGPRTSERESWASSSHVCSEDCTCPQETAEDDKLQDCETLSFLHANAKFSCSTDSLDVASAGSSVTSGYESSNTASDHSWDSLMRKYEPVLQDCLRGNRHIVKIKSLIRKLQRLQERAVAEDDYERADKFRRKLEELVKERNLLKFQLPSRHPFISSFLDRFRTQVQMTLYGDIHRFKKEETQRNEEKLLSIPYHEKIPASTSKRDQLIEEKQWIQKEIEILRARLVVLEAKDQQLRREIEEQDQFLHVQDCELSTLLSWISLEELQTIGKALAETSEASQQIPCTLDFPESIKRLQEKEQSLNMSIKDTAAKVCTSQKLCSTLKRKMSDIEAQLPALLEAKMLAVSGGNFCTAKDLVEEMKSLTAEREHLERLLHEWLSLSARNVQKLERMKDGYKRLKEEVEQGESAFEKKLKEDAYRYMEVLEEKHLKSCGSQLLERVWEVDLEACQLLLRGFQLNEAGGCDSEGEESQTDEAEEAADASLSTKQGQSKHFPITDSEWSALQHRVTQSKHPSVHWELKEEFHMHSTELEEKCEKISEKLMHLEDQLQTAICSCDESLVHILF